MQLSIFKKLIWVYFCVLFAFPIWAKTLPVSEDIPTVNLEPLIEPLPEVVPADVENGILPFKRILKSANDNKGKAFNSSDPSILRREALKIMRKTRTYGMSPMGLVPLDTNDMDSAGNFKSHLNVANDSQRQADVNDGKDETAYDTLGATLDAEHLSEFSLCAGSRIEQGLNDTNTYWLSIMSAIAYLKYPIAFERLQAMNFDKIYFVEGASDIEVFVAIKLPKKNAKGDVIKDSGVSIVSFRGTDDPEDWLTNLDITTEDITEHNHEAWLHEGFATVLDEVYGEIIKVLDLKHNPSPLFITGHSQGGAFASQMAIRMISRESEAEQPLISSKDDRLRGLYVFGAPRVGNIWARNILDKYMNRTKNVAVHIHSNADPATKTPFDWMGYKRMATQVVIPYSSDLDLDYGNRNDWVCHNDADYRGPSAFSPALLYTSLEAHSMRSYARHFIPWRKTVREGTCEDPNTVWGPRFREEDPTNFHPLRPSSQMNRNPCEYTTFSWGGQIQL